MPGMLAAGRCPGWLAGMLACTMLMYYNNNCKLTNCNCSAFFFLKPLKSARQPAAVLVFLVRYNTGKENLWFPEYSRRPPITIVRLLL